MPTTVGMSGRRSEVADPAIVRVGSRYEVRLEAVVPAHAIQLACGAEAEDGRQRVGRIAVAASSRADPLADHESMVAVRRHLNERLPQAAQATQ